MIPKRNKKAWQQVLKVFQLAFIYWLICRYIFIPLCILAIDVYGFNYEWIWITVFLIIQSWLGVCFFYFLIMISDND